jgi:hypothetical protein
VVSGDDDDTTTPAETTTTVAPTTTEAGTTTTAEPTTTTTEAPPTTAPGDDRSSAVWPFAGATTYADPVEAARSFATDYLGMTEPVVGEFRQGDSRSGEVEVRPVADGPATTVLVRQLSGADTWSVLGAATADIEVTDPAAGVEVRSPVELLGRALAFEGHVDVEVRQDGSATPLGTGFVTGGGDELRPFEGSIAFDRPTEAFGAVVFLTRSGEDGRVWQASVVRVRLSPEGTAPAGCGSYQPPRPVAGDGEMLVTAFFTCDPDASGEPSPVAVHRVAPRSAGVLRAALEALLAGPTADEAAAGITSWFSSGTAGMLRGVTITDGHAVVDLGDLRPVIPGASSSAGSALLLSELDATVFQFPTVDTAEYRIEGSCEAFTEWLQFGGCDPRRRP